MDELADMEELRRAESLTLALDGDEAGQKANHRLAKLLLLRGYRVNLCRLPEGKDPADLGPSGMWEQLQKAKSVKSLADLV